MFRGSDSLPDLMKMPGRSLIQPTSRPTWGGGNLVTRALARILTALPLRLTSSVVSVIPPGWGQTSLAFPTSWLVHQRELHRHHAHTARPVRLWGGAQVELDLSDRLGAIAHLTRRHQPPLTRYLVKSMARGGVFVDVGANVGLVSLSVASYCRHAGVTVHAFEPDPRNAQAFRHNLCLNRGLDVVVNQLAVGATAGTARFLPGAPGEGYLGRLAPDPSAESQESRGEDVEVISLDHYLVSNGIDRIAALKLDTEGHEPDVLLGLANALTEQRVSAIVCEVDDGCLEDRGWSRQQLFDLMRQYGYEWHKLPLLGFSRLKPPPRAKCEDVVFTPIGR